MSKKTLGILGGMGPIASEFFLRLIVEHTKATRDSDHIDILMSSVASTPDRTEYLLGKSAKSPLEPMIRAARCLIYGGAEIIAVPCNTAAAFNDKLEKNTGVEVLSIVEETVRFAAFLGAKKIGILATRGTAESGTYQTECKKFDIEAVFPCRIEQAAIMNEIYSRIKAGTMQVNDIYLVANELATHCDFVVLGCTELSTIDFSGFDDSERIIDSSRVLAVSSILRCGAEPIGFERIYKNFRRYYDKSI